MTMTMTRHRLAVLVGPSLCFFHLASVPEMHSVDCLRRIQLATDLSYWCTLIKLGASFSSNLAFDSRLLTNVW